jgi:hypothetical protein
MVGLLRIRWRIFEGKVFGLFSLKGDAHKIFLQLKDTVQMGKSINSISDFIEIESIQKLYQSLNSHTLKLIYYRMVKEKNGSGIIPILVTTIPWLLFLFSEPLMKFLFKDGSQLWVFFGVTYLLLLAFSVVLHFREKAWAAFHMEIIQDILKERSKEQPL